MFSRLASALYNAVDVLAPPIPLQEDFIFHWEGTTNFYTDKRSNGKTPIEMTGIPNHLNQMLSLIHQEANEYDTDTPGPCIEYMLQNKVLDTMCVLARADTPPGMKRQVLNFISRLLDESHYSLLPHTNVYNVVQKMIKMCGESIATPSEREEIDFLKIICQKLQDNPNLINVFIVEQSGVLNGIRQSPSKPQKSTTFPLVKSLITLMKSPDSDIVDSALECLAMCVMFPNGRSIDVIVNHSDFSFSIVGNLCSLYRNVPKNLKPADIEEALSRWNSEMEMKADARVLPALRKLLCFLKWLELLNKMALCAQPAISDALARAFQSDFLETFIYTDLTSDDEEIAVFGTSIISSCLCHCTLPMLYDGIGAFLVGNSEEPDVAETPDNQHLVKNLLLQRCRNFRLSPLLGMATLQLFEDLIRKPTDVILNSLVLNNLRSRKYFDVTAADDYFSVSEEEGDAFAEHYLNQEYSSRNSPDQANFEREDSTFAPNHIHKILNCFLLLLPEEIKSCNSEEDSGYDVYVKDAHRQFQECLFSCENCDWPIEPLQTDINTSDEESGCGSQPEADSINSTFQEGHFLSMVFDNLENMLNQPYEINLQVTSLVSKLALIPHPNLHEYLLNPFVPLANDTRSLFSVLLKVVESIQVAVQKVPNFKSKVQIMRQFLLTEDNEDDCKFEPETCRTLEALIVVEEFCKELAAITFVKYHASI